MLNTGDTYVSILDLSDWTKLKLRINNNINNNKTKTFKDGMQTGVTRNCRWHSFCITSNRN